MIRALDTSKISRRLKEKADDQSESKHLTSSRVLKVFQDHSDKYEGFCGDAMEFSKKENIHNVADELRTTFHTLNSRIDEELAKADEASCFSVASTDNTTVINTSKTKLSLPMFSGNILQWWDFWSPFSDTTNKKSHSWIQKRFAISFHL